jgi:signal transduction histidine kinase
MAYTLAHEINNPLTGIKLGLSTLYESLKKEENIQVLDSVMKDLNRIQEIVHSFLKVRKHQSRLKKENLTVIGDIIDDVLFHLSGQLDLQNIGADKHICNEDSCILIDRDGIHRVLLNVFLNAIQATPAKGRIVVSTEVSTAHETSESDKAFLRISLTDTGSGMDPNQRQEIFSPFYSSKSEGTGLGLNICKNIISAHSGFMEVESDKGKGTTVKIYLPIITE